MTSGGFARISRFCSSSSRPVQRRVEHEAGDDPTGLKGGVESDHRLRPEVALGEARLDAFADALVSQCEEAADVAGIVVDQVLTKLEDVHGRSSPRPGGIV